MELEELLASQRRDAGVHRIAIADRDDSDIRFVNLIYEGHIAEDIGVSHVIDHLPTILGANDQTARITKIST